MYFDRLIGCWRNGIKMDFSKTISAQPWLAEPKQKNLHVSPRHVLF